MRVLLFCYVANDGGISTKTCELAGYLDNAGHRVRTVFFKQAPGHVLLKQLEHKVYSRLNPLTLPKEVRQYSPDIVILAYSSYLGLSTTLKDLKVPVVPIVHGQGVRFYSHTPAKRKVLRKMASKVLRSFPAVIVLNNDLKREMLDLGVENGRVRVLPNGIDLQNFKPQKVKPEYDLVFSGSLYKEKRLDILFEALRIIKQQGAGQPSLLVLGTGPMLSKWKELARRMGVDVVFAGWKKDPQNYYPKAKLFVLSSDSEEFPSAPLEAMACGLPIVATRVGSLPGVVANGRSGLLVGPNDPEALACTIMLMLENKQMMREMADNGRNMVERKYGWDKILKRYVRVFNSVI